MQKKCPKCSASFNVTDEDILLLDKLSPVINSKKHSLPAPTLCFSCRLQRRLAFYNSRSIYPRKCDLTGKNIVSIYSPDKPYKVYERREWYGDNWDPFEYGRDFDFNRPFFDQFKELLDSVPHLSLTVLGETVNSEFTNDNLIVKNCYLIFDGERAEDCMYGHTFVGITSCLDFAAAVDCELCYETIHCNNCYNCKYSRYSTNCSDSWFIRDCIGCKNCFGCANLRQKQYCIFNEQKTKEEYEKYLEQFDSTSYKTVQDMINKTNEFFLKYPVKECRGEQNVDVTGNNLNQSKDSKDCFDCNKVQDCHYCTNCLVGAKDCSDIHIWGDSMELCYESCVIGVKTQNLLGCYYVSQGADNILYSMYCSRSVKNLFGCIGLRHKSNCIFNKQYSAEEYEDLAERIVEHMKKTGEWGEFFPSSISGFGYNETMAQTFFPLEKDDAKKLGYSWSEYQSPVEADRTIDASKLPDSTNDIPDDVLNWAIVCTDTGKPFKIIRKELEFYRDHKLPIPRKHPDQRHYDRFAIKNPYHLWDRSCDKCSKEIKTTYAPERPETIFCEECYLKEVY